MNIFVKSDEGVISQITSHPTLTSMTGWTRIDSSDGNITIDQTTIDYETFVKYMRKFMVSTQGTVSFSSGTNADNLVTTGKLGTLDMSVPMSFTRANTIVNFGRL